MSITKKSVSVNSLTFTIENGTDVQIIANALNNTYQGNTGITNNYLLTMIKDNDYKGIITIQIIENDTRNNIEIDIIMSTNNSNGTIRTIEVGHGHIKNLWENIKSVDTNNLKVAGQTPAHHNISDISLRSDNCLTVDHSVAECSESSQAVPRELQS